MGSFLNPFEAIEKFKKNHFSKLAEGIQNTPGEDIIIFPGDITYPFITPDSMDKAMEAFDKLYDLGQSAGAKWVFFSSQHEHLGRARGYKEPPEIHSGMGPKFGENDEYLISEWSKRKGEKLGIYIYSHSKSLNYAHLNADREHPTGYYRKIIQNLRLKAMYEYDHVPVPPQINASIEEMLHKIEQASSRLQVNIQSSSPIMQLSLGDTIDIEIKSSDERDGDTYFIGLGLFSSQILITFEMDQIPWKKGVTKHRMAIQDSGKIHPEHFSPLRWEKAAISRF